MADDEQQAKEWAARLTAAGQPHGKTFTYDSQTGMLTTVISDAEAVNLSRANDIKIGGAGENQKSLGDVAFGVDVETHYRADPQKKGNNLLLIDPKGMTSEKVTSYQQAAGVTNQILQGNLDVPEVTQGSLQLLGMALSPQPQLASVLPSPQSTPRPSQPAPQSHLPTPKHDLAHTYLLQAALVRMGEDLGTTGARPHPELGVGARKGVDGDWGPKTQGAFEKVIREAKEAGVDIDPSKLDFATKHPTPEQQAEMKKFMEYADKKIKAHDQHQRVQERDQNAAQADQHPRGPDERGGPNDVPRLPRSDGGRGQAR